MSKKSSIPSRVRTARSESHTTHGYTGTATYWAWQDMKARCLNPRNCNYKNYGARGITVCERWLYFANFLEDMGPKPANPKKLSLERIDNNLGYFKQNCRWDNYLKQGRNRRSNFIVTAFGVTACLSSISEKFGVVGYNTIIYRLKRGWNIERALTQVRGRGTHTGPTLQGRNP